jgi:DNA ligase-1
MIKPMLAYKMGKKEIDWSQEIFMQPKLDGVRCLISKNGAVSRTGKPWKNIEHIIRRLKPFFNTHPDHILDGELYNHKLKNDFEKIISLVRKQKPTSSDKNEAKKLVQFHVYDCINPSNKNYSARLFEMTAFGIYGKYIKLVYTQSVYKGSPEYMKEINKNHLNKGYEGSIMRLDKPYEQKRSYNLQKWKNFSDAEATIVNYEEGKGKRTGTLGKFIMQDDDGNIFGCPPGKGYNYKDMADILENIHKYMGQQATFTYFERTKAGSYRHPLFKGLRDYE